MFGVENGKQEGHDEKNSGEPPREFRQHVGGLRAKNVFRYAATKGCAQAFALWTLHQDNEDHQQRDEHIDTEQNADHDIHCEERLSLVQEHCKTGARACSSRRKSRMMHYRT